MVGIAKAVVGTGECQPRYDTQYRRTPLSQATEYSRGEAVKMVLEREDVNPGPDKGDAFSGRAPGPPEDRCLHVRVAKLFLERVCVQCAPLR